MSIYNFAEENGVYWAIGRWIDYFKDGRLPTYETYFPWHQELLRVSVRDDLYSP